MKKYDRDIAMYDEGFIPSEAEKVMCDDSRKLNFLHEVYRDSYSLQMQVLHELGGKSILEIGPGDGFAARNMRHIGYAYDTIDINDVTKPIIKTSILDLCPEQFRDKYHTVCAFQMLEHVPYDKFKECLIKMQIMAKEHVVISIPYSCKGFTVTLKKWDGQDNCIENRIEMRYEPTNIPNRKYRPEYVEEFPWAPHYWEIGREGYPLERIKGDIESVGLKIIGDGHSPNPFHFFIVMKVGNK